MKNLAIILALTLVQTTSFAQSLIRMTVKEECVTCRRMMEQTCFQIQKNGSKTWELFYDCIDGFEYEAGYRYEIIVKETPRPEPIPQDLSASTYSLEKIVSKTIVPANNGKKYRFQVIEMNGKNIESTPVFLNYNDSLKSVSGNSGCNGFGMDAKMGCGKKSLKTKTSMGTEIACSPEIMSVENEFLKSISNKKFKLSQDEKGLWNWKTKGTTVLKLKPVAIKTEGKLTEEVNPGRGKPARTDDAWNYFSGKRFKLIQLNGQNVAIPEIFIVFDNTNKTISGFTGCNKMNGSFGYEERSLQFKGISMTKMACVDGEKGAIETQLVKLLNSPLLTYDFAERVLNIYDGKGQLVAMFASDFEK